MKNTKIQLIAITFGCLLWAGCMSVETRDFKVNSFLNKKEMNRLSYAITDTNGVTRVLKIDGYQNDQVQAIGAIAEGVAKGVVAGAK